MTFNWDFEIFSIGLFISFVKNYLKILKKKDV